MVSIKYNRRTYGFTLPPTAEPDWTCTFAEEEAPEYVHICRYTILYVYIYIYTCKYIYIYIL